MHGNPNRVVLVASAALIAGILSNSAVASERVLYAFQGGNDGASPGSLLADSSGNLYGETGGGGGGNCPGGCGTIFKLAPDGTETVLYAFQGGNDGAYPRNSLTADSVGNFYGTTQQGGKYNAGTVFELPSGGTETVLYAFQGGSDGLEPWGNLVRDKKGNLYGTTSYGGNSPACGGEGCGAIFRVTPTGAEKLLYVFQGGSDGGKPTGGLIADKAGVFYGVTDVGGNLNAPNCLGYGCGVVYKLPPDGTESPLYTFQGTSDGTFPVGTLIFDSSGNLYGTSESGGGSQNCGGGGCGTVFTVTPGGSESVLHAFQGGTDGMSPFSGVVRDKAGNLYGTTYFGGSTGCKKTGGIGCGTVFEVAPDGTETVLHVFNSTRGQYPAASLLLKGKTLYGTATAGGASNDGVVFSVKR